MSDSEDLSTPANIPADVDIEQCLRRVSRDALRKGEQDFSVNVARSRAEAELGLDAGFLKNNSVWKKKSSAVIKAVVDEEPPSSALEPVKEDAPKGKAGTKRKSDEAQPMKKRAKKESSVVGSEEDVNDKVVPPVKNAPVRKSDGTGRTRKAVPKSEEESALSDAPDDLEEAEAPKLNGNAVEDDESELSSVIDEPAPRKKRQKKSTSTQPKESKPQKLSKPAKLASEKPKASGKDLSPDEEEIKRLQSWLIKCGIRKMWHRELASCTTSKEKIKHLKGMLDDAGMTGRYSAEKARQIKEARELKAELEAAKEFNEHWGHESGEENGDGDGEEKEKETAPARRLKPKGLVDFGDSDEDS